MSTRHPSLKLVLDKGGIWDKKHYFGSKEEFTGAALKIYADLELERCKGTLNSENVTPLKRHRQRTTRANPWMSSGSQSPELANRSASIHDFLSASFGRRRRAMANVFLVCMNQEELLASIQPYSLASLLLKKWQRVLSRSMAKKVTSRCSVVCITHSMCY
jgi:hypothetical protein